MTSIRFEHVSKIYGKEKACRKALAMYRQDAPSRAFFRPPAAKWACAASASPFRAAAFFASWAYRARANPRWCASVNRLIKPSCGEIWVGGANVRPERNSAARFPPAKSEHGVSAFRLAAAFNRAANAKYALRVRGLPMAAQRERARSGSTKWA